MHHVAELVECYSGSRYGERPLAFHWQGQRLEIGKIETQERRPQSLFFRVLTIGGQAFELSYGEGTDSWEIKSLN